MDYVVCVYNLYGHRRFLAMASVDILSQNRTKILRKSYGQCRVSAHFKDVHIAPEGAILVLRSITVFCNSLAYLYLFVIVCTFTMS